MQESNYWKRLSRRRFSRRALLGSGAAAAAGLAGAMLVGCNSGGAGDGGTPRPSRTPGIPGTPLAGGSATFGRAVTVLGIDPHVDLTGFDIDLLMYSYLYSWIPSLEEPNFNNLAASFEQPDPEHLEFIFHLNRGVKAQPVGPAAGEEMTSTDCKESFIRRGTSITAVDKRFPRAIAGGSGAAALSAALKTPDPYTFSFAMGRPFVPAVREMANFTWAIVPAKVIDEFSSLSQKGFGSGPFMLEEFRGSERIALKRHPDYFLSPRPWLDSINYVVITDNSSLLAAFQGGKHDVNGAVLTKSKAEDLMKEQDFAVSKSASLFYPVIHLKMKAPFDNINVRKALDLALNRDEMIAIIQDGEGNYNGPIQWPQTKWALPQDELRAFYRYDPDEAKRILKEAGYGDGFSAKMKLPKISGPSIVGDMAVVVRDQLGRVGINIELDEVELGAFIGSTLLPGNFQMAFFPNLPYDEPDRPLSFYHSRGVTGSGNWTNYTNPELDKLIDAQVEEFDVEQRKRIITDAQRMILEEHGPQITLTGGYQYQARWSYVHFGTDPSPDQPPPPGSGPYGADIWTEKG